MPFSAKKAYSVDSDGNLAYTQDRIFLEKRNGGFREKIDVSQEEFDNIVVDGVNWKRLNDDPVDSFYNFFRKGGYRESLLDALNLGKFGPGRKAFVKANEEAAPIAIITARGQSIQELRETHREIIYSILTEKNRWALISNMQKNLARMGSEREMINFYLNNNLYLPVASQEFLDNFNITTDVSIKERKNIAFDYFVLHVKNLFGEYYGTEFVKNPIFSVGFSDDNRNNIEAMRDYIKSSLLSKYPLTKFVLYHTKDINDVSRIRLGNRH